MISSADIYHIFTAIVPLYVAMILAYMSVKWWKLFTPEQCAGINKFVAKFSVPLLSFQVISDNNLYKMNVKIILADFVQKVLALIVLIAVVKLGSRGGLRSIITGFSLSTLPNTLIVGIPLLKAMYGDEAGGLLAQIVVLQSIVWYNLMLLIFELSAAKRASGITPTVEDLGDEEDPEEAQEKDGEEEAQTKLCKSKTVLIFLTVGKKLLANPNTHAALLGLIWASIRFRLKVKFPAIVEDSITILSNGGLGMSMFSIGLFMATQPSIIACGIRMTIVGIVLKFMAGPALMAASSAALGLRGRLLRMAIMQAALPPGVVPFVFAKEYNVYPDMLSTGVIFGMLIAVPVALIYYLVLAL
ncbi:putative auxin efflux carrier component 5 [Hibiscus syriacus]|uniref:Auxin efflux carrier component n=1 Tax=Hibiscus syriacus TaxID=106335 RepID=A0A6A3ANP8_HIBSY|nr:probable auxin efflux carrier component 1c [Hibiscus syriacus]KAE8705027.1 putative auxin efflux carrier component 5 [Hibiscus syriacus]